MKSSQCGKAPKGYNINLEIITIHGLREYTVEHEYVHETGKKTRCGTIPRIRPGKIANVKAAYRVCTGRGKKKRKNAKKGVSCLS